MHLTADGGEAEDKLDLLTAPGPGGGEQRSWKSS